MSAVHLAEKQLLMMMAPFSSVTLLSMLQGKLSQAPISTLQAAAAAAGNAGCNGQVVHRAAQPAEMPGQLFAMQAVSLVPATQGECPAHTCSRPCRGCCIGQPGTLHLSSAWSAAPSQQRVW